MRALTRGRSTSLGLALRLGLGFLLSRGLFALFLTPVLSAAGDRLGLYAVPLQIMIFTRLPGLAPAGAVRLAAAAAVAAAPLALYLAWLTAGSYRACFIPYRSYLADPPAIVDQTTDRHRRAMWCGPSR